MALLKNGTKIGVIYAKNISKSIAAHQWRAHGAGAQDVVCEKCGETITVARISEHAKQHSPLQTMFHCNYCNQCYKSSTSVTKHLRYIHNKTKPWKNHYIKKDQERPTILNPTNELNGESHVKQSGINFKKDLNGFPYAQK